MLCKCGVGKMVGEVSRVGWAWVWLDALSVEGVNWVVVSVGEGARVGGGIVGGVQNVHEVPSVQLGLSESAPGACANVIQQLVLKICSGIVGAPSAGRTSGARAGGAEGAEV